MKLADYLARAEIDDIVVRFRNHNNLLILRKELREYFPNEVCIAVSQQIVWREKAREKFTQASVMLFDQEGYEQSTHEAVARYHPSRFEKKDIVLEICSGIGADTMYLSQCVAKVHTVESNKERIALAQHNVAQCGCLERVRWYLQGIETLRVPHKITAVFADPSRRMKGKRSIAPRDYSPTFETIIEKARQAKVKPGKCMIKLAPACDYQALLFLGSIKVVSFKGQVRETLFILDEEHQNKREAVIINEKGEPIYTIENTTALNRKQSCPEAYIIEPDPAIIRAGLVAEYAEMYGASFLDYNIAYLTSHAYPAVKGGVIFKILDHMPYSEKKIKQICKAKNITKLSVKKRGINKTSHAIQQSIGIRCDSNQMYLFVYRVKKGHHCVFAERCDKGIYGDDKK